MGVLARDNIGKMIGDFYFLLKSLNIVSSIMENHGTTYKGWHGCGVGNAVKQMGWR